MEEFSDPGSDPLVVKWPYWLDGIIGKPNTRATKFIAEDLDLLLLDQTKSDGGVSLIVKGGCLTTMPRCWMPGLDFLSVGWRGRFNLRHASPPSWIGRWSFGHQALKKTAEPFQDDGEPASRESD
jgi:hypothetical protein